MRTPIPLMQIVSFIAIVAGIIVYILALRIRGGRRVNKQLPPPWCEKCGYSLYGLAVDARCPECGGVDRLFKAANWRAIWQRLRYLVLLGSLTMLLWGIHTLGRYSFAPKIIVRFPGLSLNQPTSNAYGRVSLSVTMKSSNWTLSVPSKKGCPEEEFNCFVLDMWPKDRHSGPVSCRVFITGRPGEICTQLSRNGRSDVELPDVILDEMKKRFGVDITDEQIQKEAHWLADQIMSRPPLPAKYPGPDVPFGSVRRNNALRIRTPLWYRSVEWGIIAVLLIGGVVRIVKTKSPLRKCAEAKPTENVQ